MIKSANPGSARLQIRNFRRFIMKGRKGRIVAVLVALLLILPTMGAVAGSQSEQTSSDTSAITVTYLKSEHPSSPINPNAPAYLEIKRVTGIEIDIEAVPSSDFTQKKNVLIATGQMPDIVDGISLSDVVEFGAGETFLPLLANIDDDTPNLKRLIDQFPEMQKLMLEDELYFWPNMAKSVNGELGFRFDFGRQPMIRKDILEKHGLEMPDTIDELADVLRKFKAFYPDKHIWSNRSGTRNLVNCTAYPLGSGGDGIYYDKDVDGGKWVFGNVTDDFRNLVMAFYRGLYEDGVLDPDFAINTSDQWHEKMGSGKSLFFYDNMSFAVNYNLALQADNPGAGFAPIPIMKNGNGQRRNFFYAWWGSGKGISARTEYAERLVGLFDWMVSEEGFAVTNYGVEGEHYSLENGEYVIAPYLVEKFRTASDPFRALRAEVGTGLLQFILICDTKPWILFDPPEVKGWYKMLGEDPGMEPSAYAPSFTVDEQNRLTELNVKVKSIMDPAMDRVIIGEISLDEFAKAQKQALDAGADEIADIYNRAEARLK